MHFSPSLLLLSLTALACAAPNTAHTKRVSFTSCDSIKDTSCSIKGTKFCDASTGKYGYCHTMVITGECYIQYTQQLCSSKRDDEPDSEDTDTDTDTDGESDGEDDQLERRDQFNSCDVFGDDCAVDGNTFCLNGIQSVCHQIPFTDDCWVQYTAQGC